MDDKQFVQIERRGKFSESEFWEMVVELDARKWQNLLPPQFPIENLPTKRAKNLITPADAPVPDCLTCGACCAYLFIIGVKPTDDVPPETVWNVTDESGEIVVDCYLKRDAETLFCTALERAADGTMPCGIYAQRPQACRSFEAGSDKCHAVRRIYGFERFLTTQEMFDAREILKAKESVTVSPETIRDAKFVRQTETGNLEIVAEMQDGSRKTIHFFDPNFEAWRQFQFCGLTIADAQQLIESRGDAAKID
jgi:hypothetical protein